MKTQIELLGLINLISGAFWGMLALCIMALFFGLAPITGDTAGSLVLLAVGSIGGGLLLLFAVPCLIAGIGLLKHKSWARVLALVLGVFAFFNFPLGTLIAIYTFWVLTNSETERLFSAAA